MSTSVPTLFAELARFLELTGAPREDLVLHGEGSPAGGVMHTSTLGDACTSAGQGNLVFTSLDQLLGPQPSRTPCSACDWDGAQVRHVSGDARLRLTHLVEVAVKVRTALTLAPDLTPTRRLSHALTQVGLQSTPLGQGFADHVARALPSLVERHDDEMLHDVLSSTREQLDALVPAHPELEPARDAYLEALTSRLTAPGVALVGTLTGEHATFWLDPVLEMRLHAGAVPHLAPDPSKPRVSLVSPQLHAWLHAKARLDPELARRLDLGPVLSSAPSSATLEALTALYDPSAQNTPFSTLESTLTHTLAL